MDTKPEDGIQNGRNLFSLKMGYIIDLQKLLRKLKKLIIFWKFPRGKDVLFVGTKKQAQESVETEAKTGMFYVNQKWLGGTLTNFKTISKSIGKLHELEKMEEEGIFDVLPKKEVIKLKAERDRLEKFLGGIKNMTKLPGPYCY